METPRGRVLADGPCILVDLVWEMVALFMRAHPLRSSSTFELLRFALNDQPCRPRRSALQAVAEQWIHEVMDDDTAGDYVTGLSEEELLVEEDPAGAGGDGSVHLDALQRRVSELEALLRQQSPAAATPPARRPATSVTPSRGVLFDGARAIPNTEPREEALARLRSLAGAAPMRFCAHERAQRAQRPEQVLESLQQEEGLEALETGELEEGIRDLEATVQVQQLSLLTRQQQQQKQQDPISAALSGGGGESSSAASAGSKGCMAREAFIRLMEDLPKFSSVVMANAARELGIELSSVGPGLMRDYIEKRCPLGDNRHLTQQAYLWAFAWETGFRSNNIDIELMAVASRGLVYIDQTAMDFNKTKLSWLLTALPEPQYSICQKNRLPNTLSPFQCELGWSQRGIHEGLRFPRIKDEGHLRNHHERSRSSGGRARRGSSKEALEAKEKEGQCWRDHRRVDCLDGAKRTPSPSPLVPSLPGCSTSGRGVCSPTVFSGREAAGGASGGIFNGVQKEDRQFGYEPRDGSCAASEHEAFPGIHHLGGQFPVPIRCTEVVTAIATAGVWFGSCSFSPSQLSPCPQCLGLATARRSLALSPSEAMDGRHFSFSKSQKKATASPPPSSSYLRPEADHHDELAGPWTMQVSS